MRPAPLNVASNGDSALGQPSAPEVSRAVTLSAISTATISYRRAMTGSPDPTLADVDAVPGDLTRQDLDAIVNAANATLLGGGGVDGAIHAAAGPQLLAECRRVRRTAYPDGLPVGHAVATGAGDLPCRFVIHTVGPNWNRGQRDEADLASCFTASLREAVRVGARSIAFPAISAGAYGWDGATVARVATATVCRAPELGRLDLVRFVLVGQPLLGLFAEALRRARSAPEDPRT